MEIIEDKNRKEVLDYLKSIKDKKVVGTIDIVERMHDGHLSIIKDCKKESDILVVEYSQFWTDARLFYRFDTLKPKVFVPTTFDEFVNKAKEAEKEIDYIIFSPMTPELFQRVLYIKEKYYEKFKEWYNYWGLPTSFALGLSYPLHSDVIPSCSKAFVSCKNIVMGMSMQKLVDPSDTQYNPETIWNLYRSPTGDSISRTSSNPVMGYVVRKIKETLEDGQTDVKKILEIQNSVYLDKLEVSIIDLKTFEKLGDVTDNCVIVTRSQDKEDYVFIRDGNLF